MKKIFKKSFAIILATLMLLTVAPFAGFMEMDLSAQAATITSYDVGDIIEFGWYPQSEVTDADLLVALNAADGEWISYNYYSGTGTSDDGLMTASDYMRYREVHHAGNKYRGVVFDSYRPEQTGLTSSSTYQDDNDYSPNTVYWFKYEPIRWRVLDPATGMVMSEDILDSQAYNNYILRSSGDSYGNVAKWGDADKTYYANDYEKSSLRQWLNDDFYNTAFSQAQQSIIATTMLDNSAYTISCSDYDSAATSDKIYILSYNDSCNTEYGFRDAPTQTDAARAAYGTAYARSQGITVQYNGTSWWLLRSAGRYTNFVCGVSSGGESIPGYYTDSTYMGIRPAFNFDADSAIVQADVTELCKHSLTKTLEAQDPTCTETGLTQGKKCIVCGEVLVEQAVVPSLGHTEELVPAKAATCAATGLTQGKKCTACGEALVAQTVIPALGHTEEVISGRAATCTATGLTDGKKCTVCGEITLAQAEIAKKVHIDNDGDYVCDFGCGLEYEKPEDTTPDEPEDPAEDTAICANCGREHGNFFDEIRCFFVRIINFFKNLFK